MQPARIPLSDERFMNTVVYRDNSQGSSWSVSETRAGASTTSAISATSCELTLSLIGHRRFVRSTTSDDFDLLENDVRLLMPKLLEHAGACH